MAGIIRALFQQRPGDTVTILFLLFLSALTLLFYPAVPKAPFLISLYAILIAVQIILIRLRNKAGSTGLIYNLIFPLLCVLLIFDSLEWFVHYVNPTDIDPVLIRIDSMIFGSHPTVMLEKIMNPFLTDVLQIAYSTYYFIPVSYAIILLPNRNTEAYDKSLFMILFCFYLSYLGYILFPALGPRFYLDHLQNTELQGFLLAEPIRNLLDRLEGIKRDAFPSGHTAVAVITLYLAFKYQRNFFWISIPVVMALIFSTVYCRYHYVVDVIAGLGLTVLTVILGNWYYGWWLRRSR